VEGSKLNITWASLPGALGYEVEVTCDGKSVSKKVVTNKLLFDTGSYNCQCEIRVRAFNLSSGSDPADTNLWTNEGAWSEVKTYYTNVNTPALDNIDLGQVTNNSAVITWRVNSNPDSAQYKLGIYRSGVLEKETLINGTKAEEGKLTFTIRDLSPLTSYTFKLKAVNAKGIESEWSNEVGATTLIDKPTILTGLRATAKSNKITLSWAKSERAMSYTIERTGTGTEKVTVSNIKDNIYTDQKVTSNTEYTYRVMAVNTAGNRGWSTPLIKKTLGDVPAAPTITTVSGSSISVNITWTSSETATGYDIEADGNVYNVGMDTSYEDNGLTPGSHHVYRVRVRNIYGKSDWSEAVTYDTTQTAPNTPACVTASVSGSSILVRWDAVQKAESYDVEIDSAIYHNVFGPEYLYTVTGTDLSGTEHTIRVRAVNQGGESEWSTSVLAVPTAGEGSLPPIAIPAVPKINSSVSGSAIVSIHWDKVDGATWYQLEADASILYTGTNISYLHTALKENSQHIYRVRAGNSSGVSDWSSPLSLMTGSAVSTAPENISYYRVSDSVTAIVWDKAANENSYRIEINGKVSEGILNASVAEIATTPGTQYTIRIASVIQNGTDTKLEWSEEMAFRAPDQLPDAPIIENVAAGSNAVKVSWKEVTGAVGYEIDLEGKIIDAENALTYNLTNLEASRSYLVKIRAYNEAGRGIWSEGKTVMTYERIPGVPVNLTGETTTTVSTATGCAIKIKWDVVDKATSYEIEASNGTEGSIGTVYTSATNSVVIDGLLPGERYYFKVRALTNGGEGAWSSRISVVPAVVTPTKVAAAVVDGVVRITWDKVGGADYYEVELNGITYITSNSTSADLALNLFWLQRTIRVRACYGSQKSQWSKEVIFEQALPFTLEAKAGEELTAVLPFKNVDINGYKMTLTYDVNELELVDACEMTPAPETASAYLKGLNTYIIISQKEGIASIVFLIEEADRNNRSGIAGSIKFKSKKTGTVTLKYGVTKK